MSVDLAIDTFKSKLVDGGARANLFRVLVNFPSYAQGDTELTSFMCKKASFNASVTGVVEVPFRGRMVPLEGDRTFDALNLTIINDVKHPIRESFLRWKNEMSEHSGNRGLQRPSDYMTDVIVEQLDKSGNVAVRQKFVSAFPVNVGAIEFGFDTNNAIEEFTVELRYMYFTQEGVTR